MCKGLHCDGCSGGGGGGLLKLLGIAAIVVVVAGGSAAGAAVDSVIATVAEVVKIVAITLVCAAGAGALGGGAWLTLRLRRRAAQRAMLRPPAAVWQIPDPQQPGIPGSYTVTVMQPGRPQWPHRPALTNDRPGQELPVQPAYQPVPRPRRFR